MTSQSELCYRFLIKQEKYALTELKTFFPRLYFGTCQDEGKEPTFLRSAMELLMHALLHNLVFTPVVTFSSKYLHTATFLKN